MKVITIIRIMVLFLLICLGLLFVAAAKTYNAVDGSISDDDSALMTTSRPDALA